MKITQEFYSTTLIHNDIISVQGKTEKLWCINTLKLVITKKNCVLNNLRIFKFKCYTHTPRMFH